MEIKRLKEILKEIRKTSIIVFGDFCLDTYWEIDSSYFQKPGETSVSNDAGGKILGIKNQRYSPGAGGNVAYNLADIGVCKIFSVGVAGDDLFGKELLRLLKLKKIDTEGISVQQDNWATPAYSKPYSGEKELERFDFGKFNSLSDNAENIIMKQLEKYLKKCNVCIIYEQVENGVFTKRVIEKINSIIKKYPSKIFIVNSRHKSREFKKAHLRLNSRKASGISGKKEQYFEFARLEEVKKYSRTIFNKTKKTVFISRGDRGIIVNDGINVSAIPGIQVLGHTDTTGAGDATVSAIASALSAGATPLESAEIANFASAVVVQKLRQTGTATPAEIIETGSSPDYLYRPEIAEDLRKAKYLRDTEIEIVNPEIGTGDIKYAVFDNDGTLSTLREGWEKVMEPVIIKAILGDKYKNVDETIYVNVQREVRNYIDKSTGIQTIVQMEHLVDMVRRLGIVPEDKILDKFGYKKIYNAELMDMVNRRIEKIRRRELSPSDFVIKGTFELLEKLAERGITMYLASGTDREDVVREADILGYARYFGDRLYGAVYDSKDKTTVENIKRVVVNNIMKKIRKRGGRVICFGDGPVELREVKKHDGIAVGVASDEVRRFSLVAKKRERLIKAGADIIIPDYTQITRLIAYLFN